MVVALLAWLGAASAAVVVQVRRRMRLPWGPIAWGSGAAAVGMLPFLTPFGVATGAWMLTSALLVTRGRIERVVDVEHRDVPESALAEERRRTRRTQVWWMVAAFAGSAVLLVVLTALGYEDVPE